MTVEDRPRSAAAPPEVLDDDPLVRRCADRVGPPRISCFATVAEALARLRDRDADLLLVEDPGGGTRTVSEVDVLRRIVAALPDRHVLDEPIGQLARPVLRLDAGLRCAAAARRMLERGERLAILGADGESLGFVTADAVLRLLTGERA